MPETVWVLLDEAFPVATFTTSELAQQHAQRVYCQDPHGPRQIDWTAHMDGTFSARVDHGSTKLVIVKTHLDPTGTENAALDPD
jgi:hypothetical protein